MNPIVPLPPRHFAALLLLSYSLLALLANRLPIPATWPISTQGLPPMFAAWSGYFAVVTLLCVLVDRGDGAHAVGAYPLIGRWFWLAGLFAAAASIALALTRTSDAGDLAYAPRIFAVVVIGLPVFAMLIYLAQGRVPPPRTARMPATGANSQRRVKTALALALVLCAVAVAMLYQRYTEKLTRDAGYDLRDAEERRAASPWSHDFNAFRGNQSVTEVKAILRQERYIVRCFDDLRSEERMQPDDKTNCWANIGSAWEQPARMIAFAFGERGLRNYLVRLPEQSWAGVEAYLNGSGQRLEYTLGIDRETRAPVFGWRFDSGLVMSAAPSRGGEITVLWQSRDDVARQHCPYQNPRRARSNPHGFNVPLAKLWPGIDCEKVLLGD